MKNICTYPCIIGILFLIGFARFEAGAQSSGTPAYYTANGKTYDSPSPLWSSANKSQWIFGPGLFSTNGVNGTPAKAGKIDAIYFHAGSFFTTNATFSDFTIKLSQNMGTATSFSSASWITGMTTVFYKSTLNLSNSFASTWVKIPLQSHFKYDPSKSLVFEMSLSSGQGCAVKIVVTSNTDRIYGAYSSSAGSGTQSALINFGFDIVPTPPNDASVNGLAAPVNFCPRSYDVKVKIANDGARKLDSVRINWSVDGTLQSPIYHTTAIDTLGSSKGNIATVKLDSVSFTKGVKKVFKVWTSHPNGVADSTNESDTLVFTLAPSLKGNYTIGGTGADYSSVAAAAADLTNYGICGPVSFLVDSGTYTGRVILERIAGTSSTNTILFRGVKRSNTIIEFDADSFDDWQTVLLQGANYVTIKNLTIKCLDNKYGVGVHFINSHHNTVDSCDILMSTTSQEMWLFGILGSGALESIVNGNAGDNNTFSNLTIKGGYYGIYYSGPGSFELNTGQQFLNNTITDFYREGIHLMALGNTEIEGNTIKSQRWTNNVGAWLSALSDFRFTRNNIYVVYWGIHMDFANYYTPSKTYSVVSNNMVITTGSFRAALEYIDSRKVRFYHNSFLANTAICVTMGGLSGSDSTTMRNNIIASHSKAILFAAGNMKWDTLDNNIYYAPYSTSSSVINWEGNMYSSISAWFSSVSAVNKHSFIRDPKFVSGTDLHLQKGSRVTGGVVGVSDDIDGQLRCIFAPTIGAEELPMDIHADTTKPVKVCVGDTLKYPLTPPKGFTNGTYGSKWEIDTISLKTASGTLTKNYTVIYPSSSGKGVILFHPQAGDGDSSYFLQLITKITSYPGCDSSYGNFIKVSPKANAAFAVDTPRVCLGEYIKFTNKSNPSAGTKYVWDMGDGFTMRIEGFQYKYDKPDKYSVKLMMTAATGCMDEVTKEVEVYEKPEADFAALVQCAAAPVVFSDSTKLTGSISKRLWNFGDGSTDTSGNPSHSYANAGTYIVELFVQTDMGCTDTIRKTVVVPERTTADFSAAAGCQNTASSFTNLSTGAAGAPMTYSWDFGDGSVSSSESPDHVYAVSGTYDVKLITSSSNGCSDSVTKTVTIHPTPKVIFSPASKNVCVGEEIAFVDSTSPAGVVYNWDFGDGTTSTDIAGKHTYQQAGTYDVWLKVFTRKGCFDSASASVTVLELPVPAFSADTVCMGTGTQFTNTSAADSVAEFVWDFGDGNSSSDKSPMHTYAKAGSYEVKLGVTNKTTGCSDEKTQTIIVHPKPAVTFTISDISARKKQFTPSDTNQLSYLWHFGDGDSSVQASPVHVYAHGDAKYAVKLIVTNNEGCRSEAYTDTAHVNTSGLREDVGAEYNLNIYPNPFTSATRVYFELGSAADVRIELVDIPGRTIATLAEGRKLQGNYTYEIDGKKLNLKPGPYCVRIRIGNVPVSRMIIMK